MAYRKHSPTDDLFDSEQIRDVLLSNGLFQTISGEYIAASVIARIIPDRKSDTAVCKDKFGNRVAILRWPQVSGGNGK